MVSTVAIGVDGSQTAAKAVEMGVDMARRFDAKVVLLSALHDSTASSSERDWSSDRSARVKHELETTESRVRRGGLECITLVDEGDPADVLVRLAEECGADLLVVGSKGMQRRVLGSVPNTVTHHAGCSVLVVKTT